MARVNQILTIVAGTPIQVATTRPTLADRYFVQMLIGGTSAGYVMSAPAGVTPTKTSAAYLEGQLGPASGTAPGGSFSDATPGGGNTIDMSSIWIDGDHSGDTVVVTYNQR